MRAVVRQWLDRPRGGHGAVLLRGTVADGLVSVADYGFTFLAFTLLPRWLGVAAYGVYSVGWSWVTLLSLFAGG